MLELAKPQQGDVMADLGSGDGRILIEFAKIGISAVGFELDKNLVQKSQSLVKNEGFESKISIHQKDFWVENWGEYDIITIYPMPDIMDLLEEKLRKEIKPGARILVNYYPLPTIKPTAQKDSIYLYSDINATIPK